MLPKLPQTAGEVLAMVLCPASAFSAAQGTPDTSEAAKALLPIKAAMVRRYWAARAALIKH